MRQLLARSRSAAKTTKLGFERLEQRALLSANLANGFLNVRGTSDPDVIDVSFDGQNLVVDVNGEVSSFDASGVQRLRINGGGGDDQITLDASVVTDATVSGGSGHDEVSGGSGHDSVRGGSGDDSLSGGDGDDRLRGDGGNDACSGDAGEDWVHGGPGDDALDGGTGDDHVHGDAGVDDLSGHEGHDSLDGGPGDDDLLGGDDDDVMHGGPGNDHLDGEDGDDLLDGDDGDDEAEDGFIVDLDAEFEAALHGPTAASGHAKYEIELEDGGYEVEFQLEVEDATPNSVFDVVLNDVLVGQLATDETGRGELDYSCDPDDLDEVLFPDGFPEVGVGSVLVVDGLLEGVFHGAE